MSVNREANPVKRRTSWKFETRPSETAAQARTQPGRSSGSAARGRGPRWSRVRAAERCQSPCLRVGAREWRIRVAGVGQRNEAVGGIGHVPHARTGRRKIKVDDTCGLPVLEHQVVRGEVVVTDDLSGLVRRPVPARDRRQRSPCQIRGATGAKTCRCPHCSAPTDRRRADAKSDAANHQTPCIEPEPNGCGARANCRARRAACPEARAGRTNRCRGRGTSSRSTRQRSCTSSSVPGRALARAR